MHCAHSVEMVTTPSLLVCYEYYSIVLKFKVFSSWSCVTYRQTMRSRSDTQCKNLSTMCIGGNQWTIIQYTLYCIKPGELCLHCVWCHNYVLNSAAYKALQHAPLSPSLPHPLLVHSSPPTFTGGHYYWAAYHDGNNGEEISYVYKTEVSVQGHHDSRVHVVYLLKLNVLSLQVWREVYWCWKTTEKMEWICTRVGATDIANLYYCYRVLLYIMSAILKFVERWNGIIMLLCLIMCFMLCMIPSGWSKYWLQLSASELCRHQ